MIICKKVLYYVKVNKKFSTNIYVSYLLISLIVKPNFSLNNEVLVQIYKNSISNT